VEIKFLRKENIVKFNTILIGNLGSDPELRDLGQGKVVCNFSVATNYRWKDSDGNRVEKTTWFKIAVWGRQAELCKKHLCKGSFVFVLGRLRPDQTGGPHIWQDSNGKPKASFEVTAVEVQFLDGRSEGNIREPDAEPAAEEAAQKIPF
jgi:single-strand DNA-binding protein